MSDRGSGPTWSWSSLAQAILKFSICESQYPRSDIRENLRMDGFQRILEFRKLLYELYHFSKKTAPFSLCAGTCVQNSKILRGIVTQEKISKAIPKKFWKSDARVDLRAY